MKRIPLHIQIFIGLAAGVLVGYVCRIADAAWVSTDYIAWAGEIYLRALSMVVIPLIVASIITGMTGNAGSAGLGKLGIKTFCYYIMTSLLAISTGLLLVNLIHPGVGAVLNVSEPSSVDVLGDASMGNLLLRIIPLNPFQAMADGDMIAIIFFSILFGVFVNQATDKYRSTLTKFFDAFFDVMIRLTHFIIRFTPIGVFALMAKLVAETGFNLFVPLAGYMITVFLALLIHAGITLPAILYFVSKINPWKHFKAMLTVLLTAFSTASSSATLPLTLDAVQQNAGVSKRVSSFVLPLGSTVNMDGTALYECIAALFIAQVYGIDLSLLQQLTVVLTALLASIGAAGIPMAGLVMMTVILRAVGLPLEGVGLILAVDRILDMMRTSVNVWSDTCGAVLIAKTEKDVLNASYLKKD